MSGSGIIIDFEVSHKGRIWLGFQMKQFEFIPQKEKDGEMTLDVEMNFYCGMENPLNAILIPMNSIAAQEKEFVKKSVQKEMESTTVKVGEFNQQEKVI